MAAKDSEIIVVSGLPRSGTSLMMQMLHRGGMDVVTDELRVADDDNPLGYFELERVKKLKQDASWLAETRGKAIKAVSQLLYDLPASENYRIVWMHRDLDEVLASQEKMLKRLSRPSMPAEKLRDGFDRHVRQVKDWLEKQPNMTTLQVQYAKLVASPLEEAQRINEFLGGVLDPAAMVTAVDPSLYRNRSNG